jgi:hypothetical protein
LSRCDIRRSSCDGNALTDFGSFPPTDSCGYGFYRVRPQVLETLHLYLLLPRSHRPSSENHGSASAYVPRITTSRRVEFRGCRYFVMFRPPRSGLFCPSPSTLNRPHPPHSRAHHDFVARQLIIRCLRCAGAPWRPASGSALYLLDPSQHVVLYIPGVPASANITLTYWGNFRSAHYETARLPAIRCHGRAAGCLKARAIMPSTVPADSVNFNIRSRYEPLNWLPRPVRNGDTLRNDRPCTTACRRTGTARAHSPR